MFGHQLLLPVPDVDRTRLLPDARRQPARLERQPDDRARHRAPAQGAARARRPARRRRSAAHRDGGARRPAPVHPARAPTRCSCSRCSSTLLRRGPGPAGPARRVHRRARRRSAALARALHARAVAEPTGIPAGGDPRAGARVRRAPSRPSATAASASRRRSSAASPRGSSTCSTSSPATSTGRAARCSRGRRSTSSRWPRASASAATSTRAAAACAACPSSAASARGRVLAEEIETPGAGQIRALVTLGGQPGAVDAERRPPRARAGRARLHGLDRHLPERDHAPRAPHPAADLAARARPLRPGLPRAGGAQHREVLAGAVRRPPRTRATTGRSCSALARRLDAAQGAAGGWRQRLTHAAARAASGPRGLVDLLLRTGPYGLAWRGPFGG